MKKLFTILSIAILAFSLGINASAYSVDDGYLDRAVTLLTDLDIISQASDYTDPVTRGDFTNMLVKALGIGEVATSNPIPFTDVARGDGYYDAVQTAYNLGIISRAELFNPSRIITYDEIVKMTVCAVGYSFLADHFGTYPAGHQAAANRLGMLKGITTADSTYATAYVLLYNTITTDLPQVAIVDGTPEYSIDSGTNILESAYGLSLVEGQVDSAEFFGGVSGSGVGEGYTTINGLLLKKGEFDTDSMYGMDCSAWYDATGTICTIYAEEPAKNDVLVLKSGEDVTYNNKTYTYYTDDGQTQRSATINYDCLVVLNGKEAVYSDDIMLPEHGTVKLVRTGKGGYDTVIINSYQQIVAGGIDTVKKIVTDANNPSVSVFAKEYDYTRVEIYDQNGRVLDFSSINKNDILWVAKSQDSELLKIMVSKNKFIGEYTGLQADSFINVDGSDYPLALPASQLLDSSIVIGSLVMLHLNFDGEVAYVSPQADSSSVKIAYLIASKLYDGLQPRISIKLYTTDGEMITYDTASFFLVNGIKFETNKTDYDRLPKDEVNTSYMKSGLVTYATNSKKQITKINYDDVTAKTFGGTYTDLYQNARVDMNYGGKADQYIRYMKEPMTIVSLGTGRIFVTSATTQFRVPESKDASIADERDYKIRKISGITSGEYLDNYNHKGYTLKEGSMTSSYILSTYELANSSESVSPRGELYMVSNVSRGFSPDGDEVTVLTVSSKNAENAKLYVKDEAFIKTNGVAEGSVIKATTRNGVVEGLLLVYKPGSNVLSNITTYTKSPYKVLESNTILTSDEGSVTMAPSYIALAKTYKRDSALASFLPYCYDVGGVVDESKLISYRISTVPKVIKFDTKSKTTATVDYTNISDYLSMGTSCHTVVVEGCYGLPQALFIFD